MVDVTERLLGKGFEIRIYDRNVSMSRLIGANREYILQHVPHIAGLLVDSLDEVAAFAEVVLVGNASDEFSPLLSRLKPDQHVIDLVRVRNHPSGGNYEGIAW